MSDPARFLTTSAAVLLFAYGRAVAGEPQGSPVNGDNVPVC
jgi:hypothetical protein